MKANPEIIMVDKLNGKDLKLGEYEVDDETGALYIGTYGTVFPGGSATTGGGGSGGGGTGGWFPSGFEMNAEIKYEFKFQPTISESVDLIVELNPASHYGFFPIEVYDLNVIDNVFQPIVSATCGFFFE